MKIKSYLLAGLATFALASCDDSFNDWSEQPGNPQGEAVAFGNGSVAAVDVIDFAQITESTDSVQICNITKAVIVQNSSTSTRLRPIKISVVSELRTMYSSPKMVADSWAKTAYLIIQKMLRSSWQPTRNKMPEREIISEKGIREKI